MRVVRFGAFAFLLLGFGLMSSTGCKHRQPPPPPPPPTPTPIVAPGSLVYVQRGHLARLDLDSSQITPLTSGKSFEWFPACSPDGSQVLYWSNAESGRYNIWKMRQDGTQRTQLTFDEENTLRIGDQNLQVNACPAWSFDGKKIFYATGGNLWMMDSDGYNPETLLIDHNALCPAPSPNGKSVLFVSNKEDMVYNLWSLNLSDRSLKKITQYTDWNVGSPSYSKDGNKIMFNLYRSNTSQIYTMSTDGTNPVNITTNIHSLCPKFAVYDNKIVYCGWETSEDEGLNVYIMKANGTDGKVLTTEGGASPSWASASVITATLPTPGALTPTVPTPVAAAPIAPKPTATVAAVTPVISLPLFPTPTKK